MNAGSDQKRLLTKELNVDLLKCMHTAELVQFMVDLVEDEGLVIVSSIVLHYIIYWKGRRDSRIKGRSQNLQNRDSYREQADSCWEG